MKINYFEDTDTAFIEFTSASVAETRELCENIYLDLDEQGNLVAMKIEHAKTSANILDFTFERQENQPSDSSQWPVASDQSQPAPGSGGETKH